MKKLKNFIALLLLISFFSCQNYEKETSDLKLMVDDAETFIDENESNQNILTNRKLIKNGEIEFETNDLNKTKNKVIEGIKKFEGYLSSDNEYKNSYEVSNTLIIRVPSESFDKLLNEITQGIDKFDRKEINVKDVTSKFLDIEARLKTKKELENRYLEILKKANKVTEILEVEKEIGKLRSDIESIEGRLKFLNNQVTISTLEVRIYETISTQTEFGKKFKNGFKNGWENLILFFVFLVNIWPFIVLSIGVIILIKYWRKRKK